MIENIYQIQTKMLQCPFYKKKIATKQGLNSYVPNWWTFFMKFYRIDKYILPVCI